MQSQKKLVLTPSWNTYNYPVPPDVKLLCGYFSPSSFSASTDPRFLLLLGRGGGDGKLVYYPTSLGFLRDEKFSEIRKNEEKYSKNIYSCSYIRIDATRLEKRKIEKFR